MKKIRLSRFLFFVILFLLFSSAVFFIGYKNSTNAFLLSSPVKSLVTHFDYIFSAPFRFLSNVNEEVHDLLDTYSENKKLKKQLQKLEGQSVLIDTLTEENEALKKEINISSFPFSVTSKVLVRNSVSWYDSLTVASGKSNGIKKGMLVVSKGGLIGSVVEVDGSFSSVSLLSNGSDFDIPIKISNAKGNVYGILESYDFEEQCFIISNLNSSTEIEVGDSVVTSGLDGETIANVQVGLVSNIEESSDNLKRLVFVTPKADFSEISYVTIVGD